MSWDPRPYRPSGWAPGPHLQTLFARGLRSGIGPAYTRERFDTPDDDFVDIDWGPDPGPEAPIVLVLHGLEGSADRRYVRNVCRSLVSEGIRPAALNFRGCSGEPNRALRSYHSGATDDPGWILETLRARYPARRFGAMGFSLGGNVLLKLLGERPDGGRGLVDAAVAMSVPYDLAAGSALLEQTGIGRAYAAYFLRSLRAKVRGKSALAGVLDLERALGARTIWSFDEFVTAPLNGFRDASHYYSESSSSGYLSGVRIPTLLLHAEDDPFLPPSAIPLEIADSNQHLKLILQEGGGHVGFLAGSPFQPKFWADDEAVRFLSTHLSTGPREAPVQSQEDGR